MPFIPKISDSPTTKQRLNLSPLAFEILESDKATFEGEEAKKDPFLNRVFMNYYEEAEASIASTLSLLEGNLKKTLEGILDSQTKERIINALLIKKREELHRKAFSYAKGESLSFNLRKETIDLLTGPTSVCKEEGKEYYNNNRGQYIKSVIEEYATLPYVERERVYCKKQIKEITEAIQKEKLLKITTENGKTFHVYPYKILRDPMNTFNYLVGYSKPFDAANEYKPIPCSFRISAMKSVIMEKSKSSFLVDKRWKELDQAIEERGVQFLIGENVEIHVRLTEVGEKKYWKQLHLRPTCIGKDKDVYIFNCTKAQAEFYFFKFGSDAEILSPVDLRDKFAMMYKAAVTVYNK